MVIALKLWGHLLEGKKFIMKCDNVTTVSVVNSGRAKEPFLQSCAREIAFVASKHQFEVRAEHLPGIHNVLPDLLSRAAIDGAHFERFLELTDDKWHENPVDDDMWRFSCDW